MRGDTIRRGSSRSRKMVYATIYSNYYYVGCNIMRYISATRRELMRLHPRYAQAMADSNKYPEFVEYGDCTVLAMVIACRVDYDTAYNLVKSHASIKRGVPRCNWLQYEAAIEASGCRIEKIAPRQPNGSMYTPKTIGKAYPHGYYICGSSGHSFALVRGAVVDWAWDTHKRIVFMYKVIKPRGL